MDVLTKKAIILLKSLIFHYHGLDSDERLLLKEAADRMNAFDELEWANDFVAEDYMSAFERARSFLSKTFLKMPENERVQHLVEVWEDNYKKGYVTEMEATAILNLSKDLKVEKIFLEQVKN